MFIFIRLFHNHYNIPDNETKGSFCCITTKKPLHSLGQWSCVPHVTRCTMTYTIQYWHSKIKNVEVIKTRTNQNCHSMRVFLNLFITSCHVLHRTAGKRFPLRRYVCNYEYIGSPNLSRLPEHTFHARNTKQKIPVQLSSSFISSKPSNFFL
jgi:hypothetical protein